MAITVRYKQLSESYWTVSAGNIQRLGLLSNTMHGYVIDPTVLSGLSATKTSTLTAAQINANFAQTYNTDIVIPNAAHFLQSNWNTLGWTITTIGTFAFDLQVFLQNNFSSGPLNSASRDMEILIAFGTVSGSSYAVPVIYHGDGGAQVSYIPTSIQATGGTITTNGNFRVHTFLSSGTFQITAGNGPVASLVVAGGGSGGAEIGGGGGAGGLVYTTPGNIYGPGSYPITVGAGAASATAGNIGNQGSNSVFDVITAIGGGPGGAGNGTQGGSLNGGSGGGGGGGAGGTPTAGQGFAGGSNVGGNWFGGGGGGGAGGVGASEGCTTCPGGAGGIGLSNSITGSAVFYASGGGGSSFNTTGGAGGGPGGGGAGSNGNAAGFPATANTGGGGGGSYGFTSGAGGSGIVIVTYRFQ